MGRVEHCSRPAILRAFTASNPESLVISKAVFNIISFVILAFGGIRSPFNQDIQHMLHNDCNTTCEICQQLFFKKRRGLYHRRVCFIQFNLWQLLYIRYKVWAVCELNCLFRCVMINKTEWR